MRRPSIVCQRAVQSLRPPAPQHVWVPNDLLSLAVHRFFRSTCPHQKRHGSHVPGPLEAKRRAAKRRMTVSAGFHPADVFPPSFSLGALFGFRESPQPSWRYEPPSLPQNIAPLDSPFFHDIPPSSVASEPSRDSQPTSYGSPIPTLRTKQIVADINENNSLGRAETSAIGGSSAPQAAALTPARNNYQDAFAHFQSQTSHAARLSEKDRYELLCEAFQTCSPAKEDAWKYTVMVLRYVVDQEWNWGSIVEKQSTLEIPPIYTQGFSELLGCLQTILSRSPADLQVHLLLKQLAQSALLSNHASCPRQDDNASRLIQQLWRSASTQGADSVPAVTELLVALAGKIKSRHEQGLLKKVISDSANAAAHVTFSVVRVTNTPGHFASAERSLSCLPEKLLSRLLPEVTFNLARAVQHKSSLSRNVYAARMRTWLRLVQGLETNLSSKVSLFDMAVAPLVAGVSAARKSDRFQAEILADALLLKLAEQEDFENERVSRFIETYSSSMWEQSHMSFPERLGHLIMKMREESLPYNNMLELSLQHITRHDGLDLVLRCLNTLRKHSIKVPNVACLDACIASRLAKIRAHTGSIVNEKQRQRNAYALRMCQNILSVLDQIGSPLEATASGADIVQEALEFEHIIECAEGSHMLPIAYRGKVGNMPIKQRIELAHQIAHACSLDTTRTHRQSYRSIAYIYRYLSLNSFPIGPVLTRAVVRVSITRPLAEGRFVSARRLIWVCQLVAKVEGASAAKQVESEFWQSRGNLIRHAKKVHMGLGGHAKDKAHITTMKRLSLI